MAVKLSFGISSALKGMLLIGMSVHIQAASSQQGFPNKPLRFIVPFAPGAGVDASARAVSQRLMETLNQQIIVENKPGGNTVIGAETVAKAAPDGYTLLIVNTSIITTPLLVTTPYDPIKDFAPVATMTSSDLFLVAYPQIPANNLNELIALAKAKPGQLNYGSAGGGSTTHLAMELLCNMTGIQLQHVSYKGGSQVVTDLVGGQIQALFASPFSVVNLIKSGRVKVIGYTDSVRWATLQQVPTFAESGLPGYSFKAWHGMLAPAGTPKAVIEKLSSETGKSLNMPGVKEKLAAQGLDLFFSNSEGFASLMKTEMAKLGKLIKDANVKLE